MYSTVEKPPRQAAQKGTIYTRGRARSPALKDYPALLQAHTQQLRAWVACRDVPITRGLYEVLAEEHGLSPADVRCVIEALVQGGDVVLWPEDAEYGRVYLHMRRPADI